MLTTAPSRSSSRHSSAYPHLSQVCPRLYVNSLCGSPQPVKVMVVGLEKVETMERACITECCLLQLIANHHRDGNWCCCVTCMLCL